MSTLVKDLKLSKKPSILRILGKLPLSLRKQVEVELGSPVTSTERSNAWKRTKELGFDPGEFEAVKFRYFHADQMTNQKDEEIPWEYKRIFFEWNPALRKYEQKYGLAIFCWLRHDNRTAVGLAKVPLVEVTDKHGKKKMVLKVRDKVWWRAWGVARALRVWNEACINTSHLISEPVAVDIRIEETETVTLT